MMRTLEGHKVNPANDVLTVTVEDEPGQGGACHRYVVTGFHASTNPGHHGGEGVDKKVILFQNGPIAEVGVNGFTHEVLLEILIDRLAAFQRGPFACHENGKALDHVQAAQEWLKERTRARMARGVEGTHQK